ncbi:hypothetical protein [Anaeromicrobium sediminis]|uniref:N-acetyltransferase domain-containing protein n=1 Tax=Anaeromicrobium sediminis TaxID=1478221 RepID=A0A267MN01_9FIRM|nr:hypothetical protein [Anaeromicrobium sediminis]PAB60255.1 hypothetical protein CCE28_04975 [Anaeromicrobium sediminis]
MELKILNKNEVNEYINFVKNIYKDNVLYRNSMLNVMSDILKEKSEICKSSWIEAIMIYKENKPVLCATLAVVDRMDEILQITYFEAIDNNVDSFNLFMDHVLKRAREKGTSKISAGLNLHVNYGLGFLASDYDKKQSFGMAYNSPHYNDLFSDFGFSTIDLVSYLTNMKDFSFPLNDKILCKIRSRFNVRKASFKDLEREARIYTHINNRAFVDHLFYYERRIEEDMELFKDFKHLLKEENLLFVEYKEKPVGFMLWYPDYHELMNVNDNLGIKTVIKNKLFSNKIKKFKIVEMGILPEFQKTGAILALFDYCNDLIKDRYEICESGWILKDNMDSRNFGIKWAHKEYKKYKAYLLEV